MAKRVKSVSKILLDAADLLEESGWTQGEFVDPSGDEPKYCAVGAIHAAAGVHMAHPKVYRAIEAVHGLLPDMYGMDRKDPHSSSGRPMYDTPNEAVTCWNDAVSRRRPEVVRTLRAAAKVAK